MTANAEMRLNKMYDLVDAFSKDMGNLPEVPSVLTMQLLLNCRPRGAFPEAWEKGKEMQKADKSIPGKTEYEIACGVWYFMRKGLLELRND